MAGRDVVAELAVNLTLESAQFASGASTAEARARTLEGRMGALGSKAKSVGGAFAGLAGGLVAGIGISTITSAISSGLEYASSLGEVATQLGVTSDALQEYRYAATQVGIEQSTMDASLAKLTRSLGEASTGTGPAADAFKQLGINIKDSKGNIIDTGAAMPLIAEALKGIHDPARQAALLVDIFGKSGQKLLPLLQDGAKGVKTLTDASHELGLVITPEQIATADKAADRWNAYKKVISTKVAIGVVTGLDALEKAGNAIDAFRDRAKNSFKEAGAAILQWDRDAAKAVGHVATTFAGLPSKTVGPTNQMVAGIGAALNQRLPLILKTAEGSVNSLTAKFKEMWDKVTRHSYVPDMVDDISREFDRLQPEMVDKGVKAADAISKKYRDLRDELAPIMDRLFPEQADLRNYASTIASIGQGEKAGLLSGGLADQARTRATGMLGLENSPIGVIDTQPLTKMFDTIEDKVVPSLDQLGVQSMALGDKMQTTLDSIMGIVATLFPNSKGGRLLGAVLQGGLDIAKAFGFKGFGGARANGGPVVPGKGYMVGERGPEYVSFGKRGYVHPNGSNAMPSRLIVAPSPYFDVHVDQRAANVAAPMAGRGAVAGAAGAINSINRRQRRAIP